MKNAKSFISKLIVNKLFWQFIVALFMIVMAVFFISHEHLEFIQIKHQLENSNPWYILLGIILTVLFVLLQGQMYVQSFRALGPSISLITASRLFLKRNFVSVFLPAGGFSSLMFFTGEVEKEGAEKSQIHLASTFFGIISLLSVIVVAIPTLAFAFILHDLQKIEIYGFFFLLFLASVFIVFVYSVSKKGFGYRFLSRLKPSLAIILDEMLDQDISHKRLFYTLCISVVIEIIGILHLYVAMLALGFEPSFSAAIIGYIVMVILLIASPFLRGLGAIEVALTFILGQFGFPVTAAATITLLYRFFEFWLPLFVGLVSFISRKDNLILRILPAIIIFILGFVNIISSVTPAIPGRLLLLQDIFPESIIHISNGIVLVFGLLLLILSAFLLRGSRRAWHFAVVLTSLSVAGHLLKGVDYEEAIWASFALASLLYTKRFYLLRPNPRLSRISHVVVLFSVVALFIFGIISFYFLDKKHFGVDFELWASMKTIFRMFFLFDDSGLVPRTRFGHDFIYAIYTSGGVVFCFVFYSLLKPYFTRPYNSEEDFVLANQILDKYGNSALDYFKTYPDKYLFFSEDRDGFLSFKITRHFAVVLENPVCRNEDEFLKLVKSFDRFCEDNGFICIFYRVPQKSLGIYKTMAKRSFPVGEEAILNLEEFTLEGRSMKPTRNAVNRLVADGCDAKIYTGPIKEGLLQKLEHVSNDWLKEHHEKEIAFTQGVFDKKILKNQTIITVEDKEEKVIAFLNIIPDYAKGEATYDMIRKSSDAPSGVLDFILVKTFLFLKEQGYKEANMGLAPLSGVEGVNLTEKTVKYAFDNLKQFVHFKGLRKFKDKYNPRWEPKFLIYNHNYHLIQVPGALKKVSEGK